MIDNGFEVSFFGDENVTELKRGFGCHDWLAQVVWRVILYTKRWQV